MLVLGTGVATAQTTRTLTVSTDSASYSASQTIRITGSLSPAPGPSTAVTLKLINPSGTVLAVWEAEVGATSGLFNHTLVAGGTSGWTEGTYTVNATWGAYPPQIYANTTFAYSPIFTTTTTTTTSSTTTSITTITTSTTSKAATTTSSSSGGGGIPEFPFQAVSLGILVAMIAAGYLLVRRSSWAHPRLSAE